MRVRHLFSLSDGSWTGVVEGRIAEIGRVGVRLALARQPAPEVASAPPPLNQSSNNNGVFHRIGRFFSRIFGK